MFPPLLVFSVYLLLRGHHYPGGGFVGGLIAGSAFAVYSLAFDVASARKLLRVDPRDITAVGLATALFSALPAVFTGKAFMTGVWWNLHIGRSVALHIGTPMIFDIGVYLVVMGVLLTLVFSLGEEE
jgi:multicomponent Na+:H+ antiporter subunit B